VRPQNLAGFVKYFSAGCEWLDFGLFEPNSNAKALSQLWLGQGSNRGGFSFLKTKKSELSRSGPEYRGVAVSFPLLQNNRREVWLVN
jgi:hypothetical protein